MNTKKKPNTHKNLAKAIKLTKKAHAISDENNYDLGEKLLYEAVALAPEHPDIISNYVNYCVQVADNNLNCFENFNEAIKYYKKALAFDGKNTNILTALAHAFKEAGNIFEAFITLQKAEKIKKKP